MVQSSFFWPGADREERWVRGKSLAQTGRNQYNSYRGFVMLPQKSKRVLINDRAKYPDLRAVLKAGLFFIVKMVVLLSFAALDISEFFTDHKKV